jgi:uncharacterized protein
MTSQDIENILIDVLKKHDASRVAIFGSRARGDEHGESDLDVLVRFVEGKSLLKLVAIERELTERLGIKVDLLTEASISPHLRNRIASTLKVIYQ